MADDIHPLLADSTFLAFTPDELQIESAASSLLDSAMPLERLRASGSADLSPADRQLLSSMGWFGLVVPEALGGSGLSAVECAIFFREVGRRCGPVDILAQFLAVTLSSRATRLREALFEKDGGVALAARDGNGLRILGNPNASFVILAEQERTTVLNTDGWSVETRSSLDSGTTMRVLEALSSDPVVVDKGPEIWRLAQLGGAAMLVGVAEAALDMIVAYAKVRETFGRKIGSYQAVRHPCADMALRAEVARAQLWYAAASLKEKKADADVQLDAAKHLANQAAIANADANIQLHGGIGITQELGAHFLLKRALLLNQLYGSKRALLARLLHASVQD